jgi:outer membrane protein assembly factor BamD
VKGLTPFVIDPLNVSLRPMNRFSAFLLLFTMLLVGSGCSKFSRLQKNGNFEEKLKGAIEYYENGDYYKAGILLEEILPLVRGHAEAEKATFYLAYTHFKQKEYIMSSYYFKEYYQTYQRGENTEEATFMHAKSLYMDSPQYNLDQTSTEGAVKYLQEYANKYPTGKYMDETNKLLDELGAKLRLKSYENSKLYYKTHNYKSAVVAVKGFMDAYPDSEYTEEMYFIRFQAQYHLAKNSVSHKQLERYYEAIEFYHNFVDKYPNSKFIKEAEELYEASQNKIKELTT